MATLDDLDKIDPKPTTILEWLDGFTDVEKEKIITSVKAHNNTKVYAILASLDENPFPFARNTYNIFAAKVKKGELDWLA